MDILFFLVLLVVFVWIYFLPSMVASKFGHSKYYSIVVVNVFLGWAFVPWVLALAWAVSETKSVDKQ